MVGPFCCTVKADFFRSRLRHAIPLRSTAASASTPPLPRPLEVVELLEPAAPKSRHHPRRTTEAAPHTHRWSQSARFIPRIVIQPAQRFMDYAASGAVVMFAAAMLALVWVNSPWGAGYEHVWESEFRLSIGSFDALSGLSLREWVNDGAMTFFFFVVALEIKRERVSGELRDPRAAALPIIAALGGMVVPALIYASINAGGPGVRGWGIPMATNIAFAVAVITAAGRRVPHGARVFLLSLAIVDDLGAILVIAIFYTAGLSNLWLLLAVAMVLTAWVMQRIHVRAIFPYSVLGILCWLALQESGVNATLAGVAFGLLTPAWSVYDPRLFCGRAPRDRRHGGRGVPRRHSVA